MQAKLLSVKMLDVRNNGYRELQKKMGNVRYLLLGNTLL